jgi:putative transposase
MVEHKTWGKRRSLRLEHLDYKSAGRAYHVIVGSFDGKRTFGSRSLNTLIVKSIRKAAEIYGYDVIAYCLMPDHLHLLVQGRQDCRDLKEYVGGLKSYTNKVAGVKLWQRGFYEHVMRSDEVLIRVAGYIIDNPIRAGLVKRRGEYEWGEVLI